jgi:hypothetical protein
MKEKKDGTKEKGRGKETKRNKARISLVVY